MPISASPPLKVLFLTAELDPFAKVGGLGDYSGSLPESIKQQSAAGNRQVDIRVAIPYHGTFNAGLSKYRNAADISVPTRDSFAKGTAFEFLHQDVPLYLIQRSGRPSGYNAIYNETTLNDARKFVFFSLAVADLVKKIGWQPDVIHANDWHSALALYRFAELRKNDEFYSDVKLLQVIHNMPYLGEGAQTVMHKFGIQPVESNLLPEWAKFLPLPMGLVRADWISTVSPSYADELTTEEFSNGMSNFFIQNQHKTSGILNGIDTNVWDPENDPMITSRYSAKNLQDRRKNKESLLAELGLEYDSEKPLLVFISRLTPQKGVDLLLKVLPEMLELNWQAVFLGCGDEHLELGLKAFGSARPDRFRAIIEFNNSMAHKLYAAGDILLMPSRYEPCGLSQMIAMRYGCIPVARAVGGLKDSIIPVGQSGSTGYLFDGLEGKELLPCLKDALSDFKDQQKWTKMQLRAMRKDFSWKQSAGQYIDLYQHITITNLP